MPRIILDELRKNGMPLNRMNYNDIIAGISYLSSLICNKQITKNANFDIRCTEPRRNKTNGKFNRFPAYQIFINDYNDFKREIMDLSIWH